MDELATKLVDSLTKVETALETMAPTAFQALVEAAQLTGTVDLIWGLIWLSVLITGAVLCRYGFTRVLNDIDVGMPFIIGGGGASALGFLGAAVTVGSSTTWLKILNPTAYAIKSLLNQ